MGTTPEEPAREIDARFSYANERTFLAWNRTALALIPTGVAATQLLPKFDSLFGLRIPCRPRLASVSMCSGRLSLGLAVAARGALLARTTSSNWQANDGAMRRGEPLVPS